VPAKDAGLLPLLRAIIADDTATASGLLAASPELANTRAGHGVTPGRRPDAIAGVVPEAAHRPKCRPGRQRLARFEGAAIAGRSAAQPVR
jgi:hypothetical protein